MELCNGGGFVSSQYLKSAEWKKEQK
jgi:hypothetical protein